MINFTTPTIALTIKGADITSCQAYVTLKQGSRKLTKSRTDLTMTAVTVGERTDTRISFALTQAESASFNYNLSAKVQVNWISQAGVRGATNIKRVEIMANLLDEVIEYVG